MRFLLASIYILFGLAILAMCFDLIKEGIVDKVRWFANKLGIIANDDDQIDEDRTRYANFEYDSSNQENQARTPPIKNNIKRSNDETKSDTTVVQYDYNDETWIKNIRDKSEPTSVNSKPKKEMKIDDEKH